MRHALDTLCAARLYHYLPRAYNGIGIDMLLITAEYEMTQSVTRDIIYATLRHAFTLCFDYEPLMPIRHALRRCHCASHDAAYAIQYFRASLTRATFKAQHAIDAARALQMKALIRR